MNYVEILASGYSCNNLFTPEAMKIINEVLGYFRILAPFLLMVLVGVDLFNLVINNDPKERIRHISNIVYRTIATICVFLIPTFVAIFINLDAVKSNLTVDPLCLSATGTSAPEDAFAMFGLDDNSKKKKDEKEEYAEYHEQEDTGSSGSIVSGPVEYGECDAVKRCRKTVTINGRTYDSYIQRDFPDVGFSGQNIQLAGCSCVAFLQAASGFNRDLTIYKAATMFSDRTFDGIASALRQEGIPYSSIIYYNSTDYYNTKNGKERAQGVVNQVREHLAQGKPAIAIIQGAPYAGGQPHFITLFGEDENGVLITGNSRKEEGSLEELVATSLQGGRKGFMLVG